MRLRSVLSEALRNIGAGVSHALLMFAAVLFASTLLGGYEAANVVGLETEVLQRINAYADVGAIVGGTVDGAACDRLADAGGGVMGTLAGAMRAGQQIVPLATPGKDISSYEVTPGMIRMIARNTKTDVSGVWVSTDVSKDFGLTKGSVMQTEQGTMSVAGVFDWPNDGRTRDSPTRSLCPYLRRMARSTNVGSDSGRKAGRRRMCCFPRWLRRVRHPMLA